MKKLFRCFLHTGEVQCIHTKRDYICENPIHRNGNIGCVIRLYYNEASRRGFSLWIILFPLIMTALACGLPQGALPTATKGLLPLVVTSPIASPSATLTQDVDLEIEKPRPTATIHQDAHRVDMLHIYGVASFYDHLNGQPFIPRGVNYFYLVFNNGFFENRVFGVNEFNLLRIQQDFQKIRLAGYNTVRIFLDLCKPGPECIVQPGVDGLNPEYLDSIVQVMRVAKEQELLLILTSNDIPDGLLYAQRAEDGANQHFSGYRNATFLTAAGIQGVCTYWDDLLSGLTQRHAPFEIVLGWELLNEQWYMATYPPFSLSEGIVKVANGKTYNMADAEQKRNMAIEGMRYYIKLVRQTILAHDPGGLVTMGFFAPNMPYQWQADDTRYVETAGLLKESELDFFDFHLYPGTMLTVSELVENFGMQGFKQKPVLMGETGAHTELYPSVESASRVLQDWITESCIYGFDGWLIWGYYRAPEALGETTWGFADGDGLLMKALSPSFQPDACIPTVLRGDNLAMGKPVKSSASLSDQPAEAIVDGSPACWSAGMDAPQWVEIDLGGFFDVGLIRMTIDQWPDGETLHEIWGVGEDGELHKLTELIGWTSDGQIIEWAPSPPLRPLRILRIVTTISPSWVSWEEIEVIAP